MQKSVLWALGISARSGIRGEANFRECSSGPSSEVFEFLRVGRGHHVASTSHHLCCSAWKCLAFTSIVLVRGARRASIGHLGSPPGGERTNLSAWFVSRATSVRNPTFASRHNAPRHHHPSPCFVHLPPVLPFVLRTTFRPILHRV